MAANMRLEVRDAIKAVAPPGWHTFSPWPDNLTVPAVVVQPFEPYQQPNAMGGTQWSLELVIVGPRGGLADVLEAIEGRVSELRALLVPAGAELVAVGDWSEVTAGGVDYLAVSMFVNVSTNQ